MGLFIAGGCWNERAAGKRLEDIERDLVGLRRCIDLNGTAPDDKGQHLEPMQARQRV